MGIACREIAAADAGRHARTSIVYKMQKLHHGPRPIQHELSAAGKHASCMYEFQQLAIDIVESLRGGRLGGSN